MHKTCWRLLDGKLAVLILMSNVWIYVIMCVLQVIYLSYVPEEFSIGHCMLTACAVFIFVFVPVHYRHY